MKKHSGRKRTLLIFTVTLIIIAAMFAMSVIKTDSYNRSQHHLIVTEEFDTRSRVYFPQAPYKRTAFYRIGGGTGHLADRSDNLHHNLGTDQEIQ